MTIPNDLHIAIRPVADKSFVTLCRMGEMQALTRHADTPEEALAEAIKAWPQWAKDHPPVSTAKKPIAVSVQRKAPVDDDEDLIGGPSPERSIAKARHRGHSTDREMDAALAEDAALIEALGGDPGPTLADIETDDEDLLG